VATKAEQIWFDYGRRMHWSLDKCEELIDLYSEEEYQDGNVSVRCVGDEAPEEDE
jgi:hypothetical protein